MAKKSDHIHKLKRLTYKSGNVIYFCALPDCIFKTNTALALGKRSLCWRCDQPFIMSEYSIRLAKPHCENCHRPKDLKQKKLLSEVATIEPLTLAQRLEQTIQERVNLDQSEEEDGEI